ADRGAAASTGTAPPAAAAGAAPADPAADPHNPAADAVLAAAPAAVAAVGSCDLRPVRIRNVAANVRRTSVGSRDVGRLRNSKEKLMVEAFFGSTSPMWTVPNAFPFPASIGIGSRPITAQVFAPAAVPSPGGGTPV